MNKVFILFITFFTISLFTLNAAVYKGQKVFIKKCVKCHYSGQVFIAKKDINAWEHLMNEEGKPLAQLHLKSDKAQKSWKYFKTESYYKTSKHLKEFLVEYAKDSGNVPACN